MDGGNFPNGRGKSSAGRLRSDAAKEAHSGGGGGLYRAMNGLFSAIAVFFPAMTMDGGTDLLKKLIGSVGSSSLDPGFPWHYPRRLRRRARFSATTSPAPAGKTSSAASQSTGRRDWKSLAPEGRFPNKASSSAMVKTLGFGGGPGWSHVRCDRLPEVHGHSGGKHSFAR
jgi:hypothetical protein